MRPRSFFVPFFVQTVDNPEPSFHH
jgi:hypothetical protein